VNTGSEVRDKLIESLGDRTYRHLFASASSRRAIAEQIREMRLSRGWTQADLAKASGKVQETISELENPNYGSYTYKTLQRLAEAFDVALIVKFAPFSELVRWMTELSPEDLAVPDFDRDPGLSPRAFTETTEPPASMTTILREDTAQWNTRRPPQDQMPKLRLLPPCAPEEPAAIQVDDTNQRRSA
jgi:transcriptional regulator with XRE-family HTH domain